MKESCPFCNILKNKNKSGVLNQTETTFTILSNPSLMKGHCLVIPKRHVENISELTQDELNEIMQQLLMFQKILLKKFSGCDIKQNYRPFIKQSKLKVNHIHFHLQPREFKDELFSVVQSKEKELFKDLNENELKEIKQFILK